MNDSSDQAPTAEADDRFPSGDWRGFFLEPKENDRRTWMDLVLSFCDGQIKGDGKDRIGNFSFTGTYDTTSGLVWIDKHYLERHHIFYRGYADGTNKGIWGIWEFGGYSKGGWHIWPKKLGDLTVLSRTEEAEVPVNAEVPAPTR